MSKIPFNRTAPLGLELEHLLESSNSGHTSGDGPFTKRCHALLEQLTGASKVLLTTSCTHALEMSALLLDLKPGDEVIIPSYTFVSTANAFAMRGAKLIFADVRPDTLNLDQDLLPELISPKTRAIVPVHYAGVGCQMDTICALAKSNEIIVIEDNAHGLFGAYQGRALGAWGQLATQSFHETKNVSCGEGGALLINDPQYVERAEILREKGTDRSKFFRGQVDKYGWVDLGSSYLMSDLLAAYLYGQLEQRVQIQAKRAHLWESYHEALASWANAQGIRQPIIPQACSQAYHMYYLLMPSLEARSRFIEHMQDRQIMCVFHYQPLHSSCFGQKLGGQAGQCPVTERVSDQLVRLPLFNTMSQDELERTIAAALEFSC